MNVKLTLNAETIRILRGISLEEIYDVLQKGIKSIDRNTIISKWLKTPNEEGTYRLRVSLSYQDAKEKAEDTFVISGKSEGLESLNLSVNILNMIIIGMVFISLLITIIMLRKKGNKPEEPKSAIDQLKNFQQNANQQNTEKKEQDKTENKNI